MTDLVKQANHVLDRPGADPDDDAATFARAYLRAVETIERMKARGRDLMELSEEDLCIALAALADDLELASQTSACSWCKERLPCDADGSIREHTASCAKNPVVKERDRARAERDAYKDALEEVASVVSKDCCADVLDEQASDVRRRLTVIELASRTP